MFETVRLVVLGGEPVVKRDVERYRQHFTPRCRLVNGLGPTESTVTLQHVIDHETAITRAAVPVGRAVDNTEVVLLDETGTAAVLGEIVIQSEHVALGYWQRPDLTAAAFEPAPEGNARRRYRTGDLGRLLPDGTIEFVGRRDTQVKIRGHRVELGEVEARLLEHPHVEEAVVVAFEGDQHGHHLVAYYVPVAPHEIAIDELRAFVRERLPDYMVPIQFVALEALPLTPSGKVDRKALPEPIFTYESTGAEYVPPRTDTEKVLAGLTADIVGLDRVGAKDNLFDLGANSFAIFQIHSRAQKAGLNLSLQDFFEHQTVEELATLTVERADREAQNLAARLRERILNMSPEEAQRMLREKKAQLSRS